VVILGLTGSIGMGKSTAAAMFRQLGVPVHDADAAVHRLLEPGGAAVAPVIAAFPGVGAGGGIDRKALGGIVFRDPEALRRLERILHPLVRADTARFLARMARRRAKVVVLDIPLLFETHGEGRCDAVVVVSAPGFLQRARVMARPGMTEARLAAVLAKQMPDRAKRARADFVVSTGLGRYYSLRKLRQIVKILCDRRSAQGLHARNRARHGNHRSRPGSGA
jgi:dephospho-CoA kinase